MENRSFSELLCHFYFPPNQIAHAQFSHGRVSESESCSVVSKSLQLHGLYSPRNSLGQNTGVGSLSFLQGIFLTQESNPGFPHCWQILHQLSHKGSPRILEWVAYPFSRGSSWPRELNQDLLHCRRILRMLLSFSLP